jgi:hypothetical protein
MTVSHVDHMEMIICKHKVKVMKGHVDKIIGEA